MLYEVLMGPIAISATEIVNPPDRIELPEADGEPLVRFGILRALPEEVPSEEIPLEPVTETAAQRRKRLAEEAEAERLAAEEAAKTEPTN